MNTETLQNLPSSRQYVFGFSLISTSTFSPSDLNGMNLNTLRSMSSAPSASNFLRICLVTASMLLWSRSTSVKIALLILCST